MSPDRLPRDPSAMTSPSPPRGFTVLPLAKRPVTGKGAVRRFLIIPSKAPAHGVRAP